METLSSEPEPAVAGANEDFIATVLGKVTSSGVPEPGTLALLGLALPVAGVVKRRKA